MTTFACGASAEGESCELANGNADCEDGLVCQPAHAVRAAEAVCCPAPPSSATVDACKPEVDPSFVPDPRIDGSFAAGGTGVGGSLSAGGAAGTGGAGGVVDASRDARTDAPAPSDAAVDSSRDGSVGGGSGADAAPDGRTDATPG